MLGFAARELLPHRVNLTSGGRIFRLSLVQHQLLGRNLILRPANSDLGLLLLENRGFARVDDFLTLGQFILRLPNLLLDDLKLTFLVLKTLGELVDLTLEPHLLGLVGCADRGVTLAGDALA